MTCAHVLALIDAGDFADYPRSHLDAARDHARQCPTCSPALEAVSSFITDLATLPQPLPAGDLRAAVLARIAQVEQTKADSAAAAVRLTARSRASDWWGSVAVLGGFAASLAIVLASAHGETFVKAGWPGLVVTTAVMPSTAGDTLMLAGAAALYIASMFAPLRSRS